jgi:hypothetical protein
MLPKPIKIPSNLKLWILLFALICNLSEGQEHAGIQLISSSPLPSGPGLARDFVGDSGIASNSNVIFADDFEAEPLQSKWDSITGDDRDILSLTDSNDNSAMLGKHSLKVHATLGKNNGGGLTKWFETADRIFIRFYTKFDIECDYVHHFCTLRANRSLQGGDRWSGFGGAGLKPDGVSRFSTAIEPWGNFGKWPAPGKWNFYSYWPDMPAAPDKKYWGASFKPENQPDIEKGKWICVEFMLKHNTPDQPDGEQAYWIDGKLIGHWQGFRWRSSPTLFANAFTLESYVTDRWTRHKENIVYFDNVVIAKEYIGPSNDKLPN